MIALSLNELQRNRVTVCTELFDDLPAITGNHIQLQQVILNLIMNASAAMSSIDDRPRQLLVKTEQDSIETVRLSVQEVGIGIAPEDEDRLFQAFYTTKSSGPRNRPVCEPVHHRESRGPHVGREQYWSWRPVFVSIPRALGKPRSPRPSDLLTRC